MSRFPEIDWFCDRCDAFLNSQPNFDDRHDVWECTKCGYENQISADNIIYSKESEDRMSARFIAERFGMQARWAYMIWEDMGLVQQDKYGDWVLTEEGRKLGGRMSKGNYPVPTFKYNVIAEKMRAYLNVV